MLELLETVRNSSITLLLGTDSAPSIFLTFPTGGATQALSVLAAALQDSNSRNARVADDRKKRKAVSGCH